MLYLQCTRSVLRLFGLHLENLSPAPEAASLLGNWTVGDVPLGDRRALLFMSDRTLLSFPIMEGKKKTEISDLPAFLGHGLSQLLPALGAPQSAVATLLEDAHEVALAKAPGRSVLAMHSSIARDYAERVDHAGGIAGCALGEVIAAVNQTPRATLQWANSFKVTLELLRQGMA